MNIEENVKEFRKATAAYEKAAAEEKKLSKDIEAKTMAREEKRRIINEKGWERARLAYEGVRLCTSQAEYGKKVGVTKSAIGYLVRTWKAEISAQGTNGIPGKRIYFADAYYAVQYPGAKDPRAANTAKAQKHNLRTRILTACNKSPLSDYEIKARVGYEDPEGSHGGLRQRRELQEQGKLVDSGTTDEHGATRWVTPEYQQAHADELAAKRKAKEDAAEGEAAKWEEEQERYTDFGPVADISSRLNCMKSDIAFIRKHWRTLRTEPEMERLAKGAKEITERWLDAIDEIDKGNRWFRMLGVRWTSTDEEIKKAYHALAQQYHPDKAGGDAARFRQAKEAFDKVMEQRGHVLT